jgi:hypothetical protein
VVTLYLLQVVVLSSITVTFTAVAAVVAVQVVRLVLAAVDVVVRIAVRVPFVLVLVKQVRTNVFIMVNMQAVLEELVKDMGSLLVEEVEVEPVVLMVQAVMQVELVIQV